MGWRKDTALRAGGGVGDGQCYRCVLGVRDLPICVIAQQYNAEKMLDLSVPLTVSVGRQT